MNMSEIESKRHELLDELNTALNNARVAAVLRKEEGAPEMVTAFLDEMGDGSLDLEIVGDFYFRPLLSADDPVQIFMTVITITTEIPKENLPALYEAISYVNFNLPAGSFSIDKDHNFFVYVLSNLMPADIPDELVFREMDMAVGNAFSFADSYIDILLDVMTGKIGAEGVVEFLGGHAK